MVNRLPTVGYRTEFEREHLDSKGVIVGKNQPRNAKDRDNVQELVRRKDVKKTIQRVHGELVEELEHLTEEEQTGMTTLTQELIENVEASQ